MDHTNIIDRKKVIPPNIKFSENAFRQLQLLIENDFTLAGRYFRVLISGKGCDGFTYSVGFSDMTQEDFIIKVKNQDSQQEDLEIVIDPFAAFYLQNATIDYIQDFSTESEGFVIINHNQKKYHGKFWRKQKTQTPPIVNEH